MGWFAHSYVLLRSTCFVFSILTAAAEQSVKPNIVFVLTDDQDVFLGGERPVQKTIKLVGDAGISFSNMFVTSPLCCPSRSSILTGKYIHNHNAVNNSISGNCSSPAWQATAEKHTFITYIKDQGYTTFFAGKYLNQYGKPAAGGVKHVPSGWDWWLGLVGNSRYYNYKLSVNGTEEKHGHDYKKDYLTDLISRRATEFLQHQSSERPFFMMLSTPACHAPFTPAPQFCKDYSDLRAPRNPSYNVHGKDKHWLVRSARSPMTEHSVNVSDEAFRNRWRTLLSVDDMVVDVFDVLMEKKLLDNTYIFFTGDNGFHLGQFSLPIDKRQLYEFDIRVPLMVRGPGIEPGQVSIEVVLNIDLGPTFIDLAGGTPPDDMDGVSMKPVLLSQHTGGLRVNAPREKFLVEYDGEASMLIPGCPQLFNQSVYNCQPDCVCEDARNNTYCCLRTISFDENSKYCQLSDNEYFVEMYDLDTDPYELDNLANISSAVVMEKYSHILASFIRCSGRSCHKLAVR